MVNIIHMMCIINLETAKCMYSYKNTTEHNKKTEETRACWRDLVVDVVDEVDENQSCSLQAIYFLAPLQADLE